MTTEAVLPMHEGSATAEIERVFALQRRLSRSGAAPSASQRRKSIAALRDAMFRQRDAIREAMHADFRKPAAEVDLCEIFAVVSEARHALRHLRSWMRPKRVATPLALFGSRSRIEYEPKGVALILSPWNFPFNLTFGPLVSALAAGNRVIIKPSEMTPNSSALMRRIVEELFPESEVALFEGDREVATTLLAQPFDHIFFTGSPAVGKIVMRAAAEHLSSVTLELGGKSPVIVDDSADLDEAAKKIAWGKSLNAGQICIAPDYVLVHEKVRDRFVQKLSASLDALADPGAASLVNDTHFNRIETMLNEAGNAGAIVRDKERDALARRISPALVSGAAAEGRIWREEIFGPLLPIATFSTLDEAIRFVREREKPLVLYLFSRNAEKVRKVLQETSSGGAAINDTLLHFFQLNLPFGGVGYSGMGKGHGRFGFEAFSNARGVFSQPTRYSAMQLMYPPYTKWKQRLIDFTLKWM